MSDEVLDLERFRVKRPPPQRKAPAGRKRKPRRPPVPAPYGSIPYAYTDRLRNAKAPWTAWVLLFHLDQLIYGPTRKEPLTISAEVCKACRLTQRQVGHALRQLECAGLVAVCRREGRHNVVTPLWRNLLPP